MGCCIRGCQNNRACISKGIMLFGIPSGAIDQIRRSAWLNAIGKGSQFNPATGRVCELHFRPEDWEKQRIDGSRSLKRSAVPSIHLPEKRLPFTNVSNILNSPILLRPTNNDSSLKIDLKFGHRQSQHADVPDIFSSENVLPNVEDILKDHSYARSKSTPSKPTSSLSSLSEENSQTLICSTPISNNAPVPYLLTNDDLVFCDSFNILSTGDVPLPFETAPSSLNKVVSLDPIKENFDEVLNRLAELEKENQMLKTKAKSFDKINKEVCYLRRVLSSGRKEKYKLQQNMKAIQQGVSKFVTEDQIKSLTRNSTRGMKWEPSSISEGLYFKSQCGTTAYKDIATRFHLPSVRTLQERTEHIKFKSGILDEVFQQLSLLVPKMRKEERDCHICFDEMAIEPNDKLFDPSTKAPIGSCTLPGHDGVATKLLVVMLAGISSRWKRVVAYFFSGNRNKKLGMNFTAKAFSVILFDIISHAEKIGLCVSSFSSDMGSENRALWRVLNIFGKRSGKLLTAIPHPSSDMRRLYVLPDVPHLFKNIVQMLDSNKFLIVPSELVKQFQLANNVVTMDHVQQLMEHEKQFEIKIAYRLLEDYFSKRGHFEKMQVGRASAIFNHRTVAGLELLAERSNKPQYKTTAWFIKVVVRWFELCASRCHGVALSLQNKEAHAAAISHIKLTSNVFQHMTVGNKGDWKPVQEGVMIACNSILMLQEYYPKQHRVIGRLSPAYRRAQWR